ncbi:MAG: SusD/RagB family nutrient-binding outer membrane lipoprotein [Chitinophagaceae bacterium]
MKYLINRKTLSALLLFTIVVTSSCKKTFLDVNDDPNRVTDQNVTPELIFTGAEVATGARQATGSLTFAQNWVGYLSGVGDYAIVQEETSYNIDFGFGDVLWQGHYGVLFDLYTAKQKAMAKQDTVLAGACMALSGKLWQELVDMYGDIPYSEAFQNEKTRTPKYDDDKAVYDGVLKSLDTAVAYLQKTKRSTFAGVDVIAKGDVTLWIKFANTIRLRMLIRQSETPGFNPTTELASIKASGGPLGAGESFSVNPGYVNDVNKQNPFYAQYGYTSAASPADANPPVRGNNYIINTLKTNQDPRLTRFFALVGGSVVGTNYGAASGNPVSTAASKFGPGLLGENAGTANATGPTQAQWIMTSVESMFLSAEAKARGWDIGIPYATAEAAYDSAVSESFQWLKVPNARDTASDYRANIASANWANAGGSVTSQAKFIAYQKYIALTGIDALESWSDIRRLNMMPNSGYISVNPARLSNSLPVRLLYPQSEYTTNGPNVTAEGTINQFTTKIFWQP